MVERGTDRVFRGPARGTLEKRAQAAVLPALGNPAETDAAFASRMGEVLDVYTRPYLPKATDVMQTIPAKSW